MVLVSMDVQAMRDATARMGRFVQDSRDGWSRARSAADRAMLPTVHTNLVLEEQVDRVEQLQRELTTRVDLMEIVNDDTGGSPTGGRTLDLPLGDSIEAVRTQLGYQLARVASDLDVSDPGAVTSFTGRLSQYLDDPLAMGALFERVGPAGLLGLVARSGSHYAVEENVLLRELKVGLHTADAGWPPAQREAFADALAATAVAAARSETLQASAPGALAQLLNDGKYSTEFLGAVAAALDAFERSVPAGTDLSSATGTAWSAFDQAGKWPPLGDPIPALMTALANNPAAAFAFFSGPDKEERAAHYFGARATGMAAIASAVDVAATAFYRLDDPRAEAAAWIASAAVFHFGARDNIDVDAKPALGHLLAIHMRGVRQVTAGTIGALGTLPAETRQGVVVSPPIADFSSEMLDRVLREVLTDTSAVTSLAAAINLLTAEEVAYGAARWSEKDGTALDSAVSNSSMLTGYMLRVMKVSQDAELAEQEANSQALIGLGRTVASMIPVVDAFAEYGYDQAVIAVQQELARHRDRAADEAPDIQPQDGSPTVREVTGSHLKIAVATALMENGHMLTDDSSMTFDGRMSDPKAFPWMRGGGLDPSVLSATPARDRMLVWMNSVNGGPMLHYVDLIDGQRAAGGAAYDESHTVGGVSQ